MPEQEKESQRQEQQQPRIQFLDVAAIFFNQGAMSLGLYPHPSTGEPFVSFEAVQEGISILEVLKEKTQGNLTEDEDRALTRMIDELKLAFVEAIRDPKIRELAEKTRQAATRPQQRQESRIITPDGRPASTGGSGPKIVVP